MDSPDLLVLGASGLYVTKLRGRERKLQVFVVLKCETIPACNITEKTDRIQPCNEKPKLKITWYMERKCRLLGR